MGENEVSEEVLKLRDEVRLELEAEESGKPPVVDESKEEPVVEKTEPGKQGDPWEGVSPAIKTMFDELSSKVSAFEGAESRLKQAESRIGSISNKLHTAEKAAEVVKEAPTKEQIAAAAESDEKWNTLKADFPEWAEAFDGRIERVLTDRLAALKKELGPDGSEELKQRIEQLQTTIAEGTQTEVQKGILSYFKPDWQKTVGTKEYRDWLNSQPADVKALVKSPFAGDAMKVLDKYEEETGSAKSADEIAAERKRRLKTSEIPAGGKAKPVKSEVDMSEAELRQSIGREIYAEK